MTYIVDITLVLDLPDDPTDEEIVNEVTQDLTRRLADGALDGCVTLTEESC